MGVIKPKPLTKGSVIGLALPASPGVESSLESIQQGLDDLGYGSKLPKNAELLHGYLAGRDRERAEAFMQLWIDPEVDAIWCVRGGYGCGRILPLLDFQTLSCHPKLFIGMSDVTALHIALHRFCSFPTYLGPCLSTVFHHKEPMSKSCQMQVFDVLQNPALERKYFFNPTAEVIKEGEAEGNLVGGNLSLIASLMGSPWQIETKGKILVLEEVHEAPYRIDRMLNQLSLGGVLNDLAGVILGEFTRCETEKTSLSLLEIFREYFAEKPYPTIWGFATGHITEQTMVPLQRKARFDTFSKDLKVFVARVSPQIYL